MPIEIVLASIVVTVAAASVLVALRSPRALPVASASITPTTQISLTATPPPTVEISPPVTYVTPVEKPVTVAEKTATPTQTSVTTTPSETPKKQATRRSRKTTVAKTKHS